MKSIKIAKMSLKGITKSIIIYYSILVAILLTFIILNFKYPDTIQNSGIEISTVIFIFVSGLNSFKSNFYFAKSNNISRKTFMKGLILSSIPLAIFTSIIDIVINRVTNIFMEVPTLYDMGFGNLSGTLWSSSNAWIQSNDFRTIVNTILFQFSLCLMAYVLGIVINMIYYRCNKIMKTVISIVPIALIIIISNFPESTIINIIRVVNYLIGVDPVNVYAPIVTFLVAAVILSAITFLLIRKAIIKERG